MKVAERKKLELAVAECLIQTINDKLVDGIDRGERILPVGKEEFVVEYLPGKDDYSAIMTLSVSDDSDTSDDGYKVVHTFVISVTAERVLK